MEDIHMQAPVDSEDLRIEAPVDAIDVRMWVPSDEPPSSMLTIQLLPTTDIEIELT